MGVLLEISWPSTRGDNGLKCYNPWPPNPQNRRLIQHCARDDRSLAVRRNPHIDRAKIIKPSRVEVIWNADECRPVRAMPDIDTDPIFRDSRDRIEGEDVSHFVPIVGSQPSDRVLQRKRAFPSGMHMSRSRNPLWRAEEARSRSCG